LRVGLRGGQDYRGDDYPRGDQEIAARRWRCHGGAVMGHEFIV